MRAKHYSRFKTQGSKTLRLLTLLCMCFIMLFPFVESADAPSQGHISITVSIRSEELLTGVVRYKNTSERARDVGSLLPLEDAKVELWTTPEACEIAEDYTDDNDLDQLYFTESKDKNGNVYSGYFNFPPFDGTADIKVWAEDSENSVVVKHQLFDTRRSALNNPASSIQHPASSIQHPASSYCYSYPGVTSQQGFVEVEIADEDTHGAFNIYSAITRGSRRLRDLTENEEIDETPYHAPKVTVRWSKGYHHQTEYNAALDTIFLDSTEEIEDAYNTDSILHQYGHFIQDQIIADWDVGEGSTPHVGEGFIPSHTAAHHWSEGLATFMAAVLLTDGSIPIESLDEVYGILLEDNDNYGQLDEASRHWAIVQLLYDIVDANDDNAEDPLQLPFSYIFKVVDEKDSHTVFEFWNHWFDEYGAYPHEGYPFEMAALYELHGIEHEGLLIQAASSIDLLVTDIAGLQIGKDIDEIAAAEYKEEDLDDDDKPDRDMLSIALLSPRPYLYSIEVAPEPDASPNDTYWLDVSSGHQTFSLAREVQIEDIPEEPYAFMSADIALTPAKWNIEWLKEPTDGADEENREATITCYIGNLPTQFSAEQILPETIMLNSTVPVATDKHGELLARIKKYHKGFTGSVLEVKFRRFDALTSIQHPVSSVGSVTADEETSVTVAGNIQDETKILMGTSKVPILSGEKEKSGEEESLAAPKRVAAVSNSLSQNYPNPFNAETWIPFSLSDQAQVIIKIYNMNGQLVRALNLGSKPAGAYVSKDKAAYWDGRNQTGEKISSGVYFYTIQAGDFTATKKMVTAE
jgi:hypothetical protein